MARNPLWGSFFCGSAAYEPQANTARKRDTSY